MALRDEQELLHRMMHPRRSAPGTQEGKETSPNSLVAKAQAASENLREAFETTSGKEREGAARKAYLFWRTLPPSLQDRFVYLPWGILSHYRQSGALARTERIAALLRRRGKASGRPALQAEGLLASGLCRLACGQAKEAVRRLELARALFASTNVNQRDVVRASLPLASALRMEGDRHSGTAMLRRARLLCLELEDIPLLAAVSLNLGNILSESGELDTALRYHQFVRKSSELLKARRRGLRGVLGMTLTQLRMGSVKEAHELSARALVEASALELLREQSLAMEYQAGATVLQGDIPAALRSYAQALRLARRSGNAPETITELHRWLAELWVEEGNARRARYHANRARKHAESASEAKDTLALNRIEAELQWLEGSPRSALDALLAHAKDAAGKGYGYEHLLTAHRIVQVADSLGEEETARQWWTKTRFLAESSGAVALLERWREQRGKDESEKAARENSASPDQDAEDSFPSDPDDLPRVPLRRHGIITLSRKLQEQASWIARLAPTKVPVLIQGQSGTGKELFARLVHDLSPRVDFPFLAVNCGALPAEIIESELFGHRRGAFTGAVTDKPGLFREAHRGTLFLDEIGEMPAQAQAKLLRVLESGEMRAVGGVRYETVDVRIVAATNVDLNKKVVEGRFRKDLYYRLKGLEILLPPLRERLADVPPLAQFFLETANRTLGKNLELPFSTLQWLMGQAWPGNVRQLKLAIESAAGLAPSAGLILPRHFAGSDSRDEIASLPEELVEIERARVRNALEATDWNTTAAARLLGMSRTTLSGRMKKLGLRKPRDN